MQIMPVARIEQHVVSQTVPGPVTQAMIERYRAAVE